MKKLSELTSRTQTENTENKHLIKFSVKDIMTLGIVLIALIALTTAVGQMKAQKNAEAPEQIIEAAPKSTDVIKKTDDKKKKAEVVEKEPEYNNIDSANDYINFEKLIMQVSEYTDPEKNSSIKEDTNVETSLETSDGADEEPDMLDMKGNVVPSDNNQE